jgi:hypothetical protein
MSYRACRAKRLAPTDSLSLKCSPIFSHHVLNFAFRVATCITEAAPYCGIFDMRMSSLVISSGIWMVRRGRFVLRAAGRCSGGRNSRRRVAVAGSGRRRGHSRRQLGCSRGGILACSVAFLWACDNFILMWTKHF